MNRLIRTSRNFNCTLYRVIARGILAYTTKTIAKTKVTSRVLAVVLAIFVPVFGYIYLYTPTLAPVANATTNNTINFQARLLTNTGALIPDGNYHIEFKIYDSASAGSSAQGTCSGNSSTDDCWWRETRTTGNLVTVKNGYITANLGSVTSFPANMPWDQELWLAMNIGGNGGSASWDGEMSPRMKITAVPYAMRSAEATQLKVNNGSITSTLSLQSPTVGNQVFQIQDQGSAGTYNLCVQNSTACGFAPSATNGYVQLAPNTVQTDATTNNSIFINKTGASGNILQLQKAGVDVMTLSNTGAVTLQNSTDSASALKVLTQSGVNFFNVDSTNQQLSIRNKSDVATIGADVFGADNNSCSGTNWTDTGTNVWQHTAGSASTLDCSSPSITSGLVYEITYSTSGTSSGESYILNIGNTNSVPIYGDITNGTTLIKTFNTNLLMVVPSALQTGSITIASIKPVYNNLATLVIKDSTDTTNLEVRTPEFRSVSMGTFNLAYNTTGYENTSIGYQSQRYNTSGFQNTSYGAFTLTNNTSGFYNTALGYASLNVNTIGTRNTATGYATLQNNTTGYQNTANGHWSLKSNTTGYMNSGYGSFSLRSVTTGYGNTAIGTSGLQSITTGYNNSSLGIYAGYNGTQTQFKTLNNLQGSTILGAYSQAYANNTLALGGQGLDAVKVGIGTGMPTNQLSAESYRYSTGTVTTNGTTTVTGTGTTFTSDMVGNVIYIATNNSTTAPYMRTITGFTNATTITVDSTVPALTNAEYYINYIGLQVSTTGNVGINALNPANKLSVNSLTTADTTAQVAISTGATGNKGLVIQGVAGQTGSLLQLQDSAGTYRATLGYDSLVFANGVVIEKDGSNNGVLRTFDGSAGKSIIVKSQNIASNVLVAQGIASQAGDLFQLQNNTGNVLSYFNANGDLSIGGANSATSASAFAVKDTGNATLFNVNTLTRTGGQAGNVLKVGNSTGTDTDTTLLVLDGASANPTTNLASLNGALFYNSTTNKVSAIENGAVVQVCTTGAVCAGYQATPATGSYIKQVPTATADNTITPTANSVVGLTVNGTSGTAATALAVSQPGAAAGVTITSANNTATNGLSFSGTFTNYISAPNFSVTNAGAVTAVGVNSGTGLVQGTGGLTITGTTNINTSGANATNIGTGTNTGTIGIGSATAGTISIQSAGAVNTTAGAASTISTSAGALTLTSAAAATWSTAAGNLTLQAGSGTVSLGTSTALTATGALGITSGGANALTLDTGGAATLSVGVTNANALSISRSGITTTVNGILTVAENTNLNGNTTIGNATTDRLTVISQILGGSPLVFQGATDNGFATTFAITDPTANNTITFPDASGTVLLAPAGSGNGLVQVPTSNTAGAAGANVISPTGNGIVGLKINTTSGTVANALQVNTATTAVTGADVVIAASSASTIPLVVQVAPSPTVNAFQVRLSDGQVAAGISASGRMYVASATPIASASLSVSTGAAGNIGGIIKGVSGQTGNLFELRDTNDLINASFNALGNQLTLGRIASSGTVTQGQLLLSDGTTSNFGTTLQANTLTANRTISLPNESGTICLQNSTNCGFAPSATNGYVQLAPASAQTDTSTNSSIFINKTGASGNILQLQKANSDVFTVSNTGATTIQSQTNTLGALRVNTSSGADRLIVNTTDNNLGSTPVLSVRAMADVKTLGAEMAPANFSSGWTTTNWNVAGVTTAVHNTGNVSALTTTGLSISANATYKVTFTLSGACGTSSDTLTVTLGGQTLATLNGNDCSGSYQYVAVTSNTNQLALTPTTSWAGTISNVSVMQYSGFNNATIAVKNTSDTTALEIRVSNNVSNTFIGLSSGINNVSGTNNMALGDLTLNANTSGSHNSAIGSSALRSNVSGSFNVGIGSQALINNTSGSYNIANGYGSLNNNTTGSRNVALGTSALYNNTTALRNTSIGDESMYNNTTGGSNTAIGANSLKSNTTGSWNTAVGQASLFTNSTGTGNTALGFNALNLSTGTGNIGIGYQAGDNLTSGASNIFLGYNIDAQSATGSDQLSIGNLLFGSGGFGTGTTVGAGGISIGTTTNNGRLTVSNGSAATNILDVQDNTTSVFTIADGGATTFKNQTNSTTAFQVQSSGSSTPIFNVDTTNSRIGINTAAPTADLSFGEGANRTINVITRTTAGVGYGLSVTAGGGNGANAGGVLTLQGGAGGATSGVGGAVVLRGGTAGGGNTAGGDITVSGGTGAGTGLLGVVKISNPIYNTATETTCAVDCNITQANVSNNGAVIVNASANGLDITLVDPTVTTAGRVVYITAANGSQDFTLRANVGGGTGLEQNIAMRQNTTATMIWNGSDWTAAGASSSTTLQAAYDNTLSSAGGAEIVLNNTATSNGLTVRNNDTNPIIGGIFETQTSIGSNLFSVNNNATEYATNGGAETQGASASTFPASTWDATGVATVDRWTTTGDNIATGAASVRVQATATNHGARNRLSATLTSGLTYSVSFAVRGATNFTTLDIRYSPDGTTTGTTQCSTAEVVTSGIWTRINCTFVASGTITASNSILIRQTDATARTFYIDNLSVNINASATYASDGSVDNAGAFATNWTTFGAGTSVARDTAILYDSSASARVDTPNSANVGIRNNLSIVPATSTQYLVSFYARSATGAVNDLTVRYSRDGGTNFASCVDYSTQVINTTGWTKITCLFTTDGTTATNADLVITQNTAPGGTRSIYVDALAITLNTNNANNVQIGGANKGGPTTLFTLDRSDTAPIAANNDAYLGSMYYDTTTGRIQCYEADGWGACGSAPDNIVNLNPEYAGAVLNGTGVGTMTADLCADQAGVLEINTALCDGTGSPAVKATNFYRWTSPQASQQTYSIYVSYQLPTTFKGFASDDTVQLTARVDSTTNASVTYEMFKSESGTLTRCGTAETAVTTNANEWQTVGINGNEATGCGFNSSSGGAYVIFKINVKANSNANAYVSTLSFVTTGK